MNATIINSMGREKLEKERAKETNGMGKENNKTNASYDIVRSYSGEFRIAVSP